MVTQNALDCSTALSDAGFANPAPIAYNSAGSSVTIAADYTSIFNHVSAVDCPLTTCELREPLCGSPLAAQSDVILGASPFGIAAVETNAAGYSLTFCYYCTIGANVF